MVNTQEEDDSKEIVLSEFQTILDSANITGSVLLLDPESKTYYSNNFERAKKGFLPASTFKIANSIIALELGNVKDEASILKWDSIERNVANWNKDLTLGEAFRYSCVPCYQALARKAGVKNLRNQLDKIEFPGMVFDSSSIDMFWLQGESNISQFQQIEFLQKLKNKELNLKASTYKIMKSVMQNEVTSTYTIYGKTGLAIRDTTTYGWYVGYVEKGAKTYYFASNLVPTEGMDLWNVFVPERVNATVKALDIFFAYQNRIN